MNADPHAANPGDPPSPRRHREHRVRLDRPGRGTGRQVFSARVRDLSCHGLFLACDRPPQPGERLTVRFTLPARGPVRAVEVEAEAEVRHRRTTQDGRGAGLRFLRLPRESELVIKAFVEKSA